MSKSTPRLYADLASWWPIHSHFEEYEEEAAFFRQVLLSTSPTQPNTLLELGSGGNRNAFHLKKTFQITLVDLSPGMLAVSREINSELEHLQGGVRCEYDRHVNGLFKRADWLRFIQEAGFEPGEVAFTHGDAGQLEAFTGSKR